MPRRPVSPAVERLRLLLDPQLPRPDPPAVEALRTAEALSAAEVPRAVALTAEAPRAVPLLGRLPVPQATGWLGSARSDVGDPLQAGHVSEGPAGSVGQVLAAGVYDPGRRGALALVAVAVVAALVAGAVLLRGRSSEQPLTAPPVAGTPVSTAGPQLVVDVEGKVRRPGLVRLPDGARVDDALRAAGGVLPGVSVLGLNLAQKLTDGQQVLVGLGPAPGAAAGAGGASAGGLLDLNLATADDLDGLPGIGRVLAQRIVDWRTEHGRFASVDQLQEVSGIGASKYASLKSKVRV